jgi:hypothetical protein
LDEGVRNDATLENLAALRPLEGGVVTAGNASQQNDAGSLLALGRGIVRNHPWFRPFGRTPVGRTTKFAPGEFVEPSVATRQMPLITTRFVRYKKPRVAGLLYLAVVAVCCEPVSFRISLF